MPRLIPVMVFSVGLVLATGARAGLVAYYPLDGDTDDASGNANDATNVFGGGFIDDVPPQIGGGMAFEMFGTVGMMNAGFQVDDDPTLDIADALTISAWVNMTDVNTFYFIAAKAPSGTANINFPGNYEFRIEQATGNLQFLHQTSEGNTFSSYTATAAVTPFEWNHVAVTAVAGGNVAFFVDGAQAGTFAQSGNFGVTNDNPLLVGTRADSHSSFNGWMDDLSIWDEALGVGKIGALAGGGDPLNLPDFNPADINLDSMVDMIDYMTLRDNFGTGTTFAEGDIDGNGIVNGADFRILKNNFGVGGAPAGVPEPGALALLWVGAGTLLFGKRRRRVIVVVS